MENFTTEQERFWAGRFGNDYIDRNVGAAVSAWKLARFARIVQRTGRLESVLELGANVGLNLRAIRVLNPDAELAGVEINPDAAEKLAEIEGCEVHHASILDWKPPRTYDLVFTSGVLIHVNPDRLTDVYDLMAASAARFVMMAEYYNPTPVAVEYRGHSDRLFKRDFAGEFLDRHTDFVLDDYAFEYHRSVFAPDDVTWFLLRRRS
jgi:spore coat polysaccharide biosynthesis protein SpsF